VDPGTFTGGDGAIKATAIPGKTPGREERGRKADLAGSVFLISKPGIAAGVGLAGLAGMVLAARGMPGAGAVVPCLASVIAASFGAAVLNGILDTPMDARMPRLAGRVEAMRRVGSEGALGLSLFLILVSLLVAFRFFHGLTVAFLLAAVLFYTLLYTLFLKRRSPYGTIPGGIPGALPVLIGYSAVAGRVGMDGIILFLVMILWQPPHFWALALAHKEEYRDAGVPVLPVALGEPAGDPRPLGVRLLLGDVRVVLLPALVLLSPVLLPQRGKQAPVSEGVLRLDPLHHGDPAGGDRGRGGADRLRRDRLPRPLEGACDRRPWLAGLPRSIPSDPGIRGPLHPPRIALGSPDAPRTRHAAPSRRKGVLSMYPRVVVG
jgi:protoheme IX farnesyltransferase